MDAKKRQKRLSEQWTQHTVRSAFRPTILPLEKFARELRAGCASENLTVPWPEFEPRQKKAKHTFCLRPRVDKLTKLMPLINAVVIYVRGRWLIILDRQGCNNCRASLSLSTNQRHMPPSYVPKQTPVDFMQLRYDHKCQLHN